MKGIPKKSTYFEFSKAYFKSPEKIGWIDLYQVGELELSANSGILEHTQVCCEISCVLSGEGFFYTEDTEIPVSAGDVHIISKGARHTIRSAVGSELRFAFLGFDFNEDLPAETVSDLPSLFSQNPRVACQDDGKIRQLFNLLITENYNESKGSALACESLMNYILILTDRLFSGIKPSRFPSAREGAKKDPLYNIIRYIDESTPSFPTVGEICNYFNYSESYVSHLFKQKTGTSVRGYILDRKLQYSQGLLREGKLSVSEIAHSLGYASVQSFCKSFRSRLGCTPGEYKKYAESEQKADWDT